MLVTVKKLHLNILICHGDTKRVVQDFWGINRNQNLSLKTVNICLHLINFTNVQL